jgi:hypothetical protein
MESARLAKVELVSDSRMPRLPDAWRIGSDLAIVAKPMSSDFPLAHMHPRQAGFERRVCG